MYPLWIIVGRSGQGKVLPQEDWIPGCHSAIAYDTKSHPKHTDCKFVRPSGNSAYSHEQHSRGKFPNALSPLHRYCNSTCLTKCWSAGSPDLSPIEQVRNIIGRQLQQHTQPAPNSPVLTQQVQQACNSIQQNDIWHNVCTLPGTMEQQIADLLRQNQDLIRALQIRDDSHSHKVTVQFEKFDEENENFDSFIERFETYLDVQNVPIANRAKVLFRLLVQNCTSY
ncbi:HTH_Tnp_Tc3_2 domain-containing protein [Trichonephila clavipes]|nr:HTH_Tnp_Tc3_2 domain-containing protein [Trichonephila clavipes]